MKWAQLALQIDQHFNEEEMRSLCFDLGLDYESLGGRGKSANARELVSYFQQNGRYQNLHDPTNKQSPPHSLAQINRQKNRDSIWHRSRSHSSNTR